MRFEEWSGRSDEWLMLAWRDGSEDERQEAWKILAERYQMRIKGFMWKMIHDAHDAEDLTQETFIRVDEHRSTYRGGCFKAWLFRIACNLSFNWLGRRNHVLQAYGEIQRVRDSAIEDPRLADLRRTLLALPNPGKAVLALKLEGYSLQEIAEIRECSERSVRRHLNRAQAEIRKALEPALSRASVSRKPDVQI